MAANRFDVYSVGLITLRCLFPSLTSRRDMERFVAGDLQKSKSFDSFINLAIAGRMGTPGGTQAEAKILDSEPRLQALRSLLSVMLTVKPSDRADGTFHVAHIAARFGSARAPTRSRHTQFMCEY